MMREPRRASALLRPADWLFRLSGLQFELGPVKKQPRPPDSLTRFEPMAAAEFELQTEFFERPSFLGPVDERCA